MKKLLKEYLTSKYSALGRKVNVALVGLGSTNLAIIDMLSDMREYVSLTVRNDSLPDIAPRKDVKIIASKNPFESLYEDVLIASPSVRRERITIPQGSEFISDYSLLFGSSPEKIFAVTGSDGKSTTTAIASLLLSPRFPKLFTGGNLGVPLWRADLCESKELLLELSSFTLRYSVPRAYRAVLTNITPNHLDWHTDLEEYTKTKLSLIRSADEPILNLYDQVSEKEARRTKSFCLISDSLSDKEIRDRYNTEHTVTLSHDALWLDGKRILSVSEINRNEEYNLKNLASAIALSIDYADLEHTKSVAMTYNGLPERCERILKNGVLYVSSSIDSTPSRTRATLIGLNKRVRIILGGRGKSLSLIPLKDPLIRYAERISVYGEIKDDVIDFIDSDELLRRIPHKSFTKMKDAFDYAADGAECGDTVLLSPAATSYGEFRNYTDRGATFKKYVNNIQKT